MAQFPLLKLTRTGQEMTGMSQGGGKLTFVRVELGDGELKEGDSIETLTALKHGIMQLPLQGYQSEGNGKARLRFIVDNSALAAGFINREIGVFAKIENGAEQLYAYTNAGNYADWIPSKETPIDGDIIDLHIVIGNAPNVVIETSNGAYATKIDIEEHNKAPDAHADLRALIANAGIAILQRNKTYAVGDIAYHKALPSWARLECVKAGTTGATLPTKIEQMVQNGGVLITDGTVVWILDDVRDGARVGDIILRPTLRDGYIKANGATVKASEYPRLLAWVQESNMTVTAEQYARDCSKYVYDSAQDKLTLPNATGRVLQGGEQVKSIEAGLPNIKGTHEFHMNALANYGAGAMTSRGANTRDYSLAEAPTSNTFVVLDLDASRSNPIYGSSDTVQPPAFTLIAQIKY